MTENNPKRNSRRRRRKRRSRNYLQPEQVQSCPLCEQPVRDILTAIVVADGAAHFDCVVKKLTEEEDLRVKEKICYLGGGAFGIVKFQGNNDTSSFSIRKRIQFEQKDTPVGWRKRIAEQNP